MTASAKESLYHAIEQLNEEECRRTLDFVQNLQPRVPPTLEQLVGDSTFNLPTRGFKAFQRLQPIQGKGIPASRLLTEDRH